MMKNGNELQKRDMNGQFVSTPIKRELRKFLNNSVHSTMAQKNKKALITGITGQDGSYLTEFLLGKGYEVHGIIRRASTFNTSRIDHLYQDPHHPATKFFIHHGDLLNEGILRQLLDKIKPDEVYNLAAQSHVQVSFLMPEYTAEVVALGALRLLEAVRAHQEHTGKQVKFYQASSSEMFG